MFKKAAAFLLCAVFILAGCESNSQKKEEESVKLFFLNTDMTAMAEEDRKLPEGEEILSFAVNALAAGPQSPELRRALPENTKVLDIKKEGGNVTVNLSAEFDSGDDMQKLWSRYTLVETVCSVPGVQKVQILVEGRAVNSISNGKPLGMLGKDDIITDSSQITNDKVLVTLYFSDSDAMHLVPETRQISEGESDKIETAIINELLKGPKNTALAPVLPQDIKLLSAETKDGVCFVNFSADFISKISGGTTQENLALYSIVNSLCELDKVNKVQILVEGKKPASLGSVDLSQPFEADYNLFAG